MTPELELLEICEYGSPSKSGNLIGIQPFMEISDYASAATFSEKIESYFKKIAARGWFSPKSIVVLPEYTATWLLVADEKKSVCHAKTVEGAMIRLIFGHFGEFFKYFLKSPAKDRVKYAIFRMKAQRSSEIYYSVFSKLAKNYAVTIVAGSIVLPEIEITSGSVKIIGEKLFNTTLVFHPDGQADPQILHKIYPTPQELPFTEPGQLSKLPVYTTPAGKLGVLNCADSWYKQTFEKLKELKVDFLAVPSFVEKDNDMHLPWRGNNITPLPPEFDSKDFLKITYDDAWIKYALPARFAVAGVKTGINVFLRGKFWSLGSDGRSILISDGKLIRGKDGKGAAIQNVWLDR